MNKIPQPGHNQQWLVVVDSVNLLGSFLRTQISELFHSSKEVVGERGGYRRDQLIETRFSTWALRPAKGDDLTPL